MIKLGDVELDQYLQIPDWYTSPRRLGSERYTLGGRLVVQRYPGSSVQAYLTLTARREGNKVYGRFFRHQIEAIRVMADNGEPVMLDYHGRSSVVVVPLDGINVDMIGYRTDPVENHPYTGTIRLLRF